MSPFPPTSGMFFKLFHFIFVIEIKEDNTIIRDGLAIIALIFQTAVLLSA